MIIEKKDIENLQKLKIKHDSDEFPLVSNYLFINEKQCIFISKNKKLYQVIASPQCFLVFVDSQSFFNVLYSDFDLKKCISFFKQSVRGILK